MSNQNVIIHEIFQKNFISEFSNKTDICLLSFSKLKSNKILSLCPVNSFNIYFTPKDEVKKSFNKLDEIYLKNININIPSFPKEENKTEFMNDYGNSFAYFCGISKNKYVILNSIHKLFVMNAHYNYKGYSFHLNY